MDRKQLFRKLSLRTLTDQPDTRHVSNYWKVIKNRLAREGCELVTNCNQLKMPGADGKLYKTDGAGGPS